MVADVTAAGILVIVGAPVVLVVIVWALVGAQRPRPGAGAWFTERAVPTGRRRRRIRREAEADLLEERFYAPDPDRPGPQGVDGSTPAPGGGASGGPQAAGGSTPAPEGGEAGGPAGDEAGGPGS